MRSRYNESERHSLHHCKTITLRTRHPLVRKNQPLLVTVPTRVLFPMFSGSKKGDVDVDVDAEIGNIAKARPSTAGSVSPALT